MSAHLDHISQQSHLSRPTGGVEGQRDSLYLSPRQDSPPRGTR
jgi:hypothetical protein